MRPKAIHVYTEFASTSYFMNLCSEPMVQQHKYFIHMSNWLSQCAAQNVKVIQLKGQGNNSRSKVTCLVFCPVPISRFTASILRKVHTYVHLNEFTCRYPSRSRSHHVIKCHIHRICAHSIFYEFWKYFAHVSNCRANVLNNFRPKFACTEFVSILCYTNFWSYSEKTYFTYISTLGVLHVEWR